MVHLEGTGGDYLDEFNELSNGHAILHQNNFNKNESLISKNQIDSINFVNSRAFQINEKGLDNLM